MRKENNIWQDNGVYPCYENQFQIDKAAAEGPASYVNIADCETLELHLITI